MVMHDLALFGRVALAAGLGFTIGWEREVRGHPAGSHPAGHVRGLTTAAAIWSTAAVGVIAGAGRFVPATLVASQFLALLEIPNTPVLNWIDAARWSHRFDPESGPTQEGEDGTERP